MERVQSKGGDKVTVACKMPNGLVLRLFRMEDHDEPVMGGGMKTVKRAVQMGEEVVVKGNAVKFGAAPGPTAGGYALTSGIDKEFFDEWLRQNANSDLVKNKIVFASGSDVNAVARDQKNVRSGLEPLDPSKPPVGLRLNSNLSPVGPDDKQATV